MRKRILFPSTNRVHQARQQLLLNELSKDFDVHICTYSEKDLPMAEKTIDITNKFKEAVRAMDFKKLAFDEDDKKRVRDLYLSTYNFFGMTMEERLKMWPPQQHTYIEVPYSTASDEDLERILTT